MVLRKIVVGAAAGLLAVAMSFPASSQTVKKLRIQSAFPTSGLFYQNLEYFANQVEKLSGGRIDVELLAPGTVVPPFESLDAVAKGVLDGAHTAPAYWVGKERAATLFGPAPGGPFGMDEVDYMSWIYDAGGLALYRELYQDVLKRDVVPFPLTWVGDQALGFFKKPIQGVADLKGRKCRQTGVTAEVFNRLGMATVNLPGGEIVPAGERGVIECAEWVGPAEDVMVGFHTIWKEYYLASMHEPATVVELILNGKTFRDLPADLQEIIRAATIEATFRSLMIANKRNAEVLAEMKEKHGVNVHKVPEEINKKILETWDEIAREAVEKNPFFKKVYDSQREFASKVVPAKNTVSAPHNMAIDHYFNKKQ